MRTSDYDTLQTRASLLGRLKDWNDQTSWQEFHDTYQRLILNFALKQGLNEREAQDVTQDTVFAVAKAIRNFEYDPARSSFKNWLLTVTRHRIVDYCRKRAKEPEIHRSTRDPGSRTATLDRIPDPHCDAIEARWDTEWQETLIARAQERLKPQVKTKHFQIFYLRVIKQQSAAQAAKALGVTRAQVYLVKKRLMPLFKRALAAAERELELLD